VFERDFYRCCYCGSQEQLAIDHFIPVQRGGGSGLANLVTSCRSRNSEKSDVNPVLFVLRKLGIE
jgi:5-methylcytosine-specific restriction endonuclease McrA